MPPIDDELNGLPNGSGSGDNGSSGDGVGDPPSAPPPEDRINTLQSRIDAVDRSLQSINGFMENLSRSQQTAQSRQQDPDPQQADQDDMSLLLSDPKAYREKLKREVAGDVTRVVMGTQESSRMEQELLEEFPELKDTATDFWKQVDGEYRSIARRMGREGEVGNVTIARAAAEMVDRKRLKKQMADRSSEPSFPGGGPSGIPPTGGTVRTSSGQSFRVTEEHMSMASALGLSDKDLSEVYKTN